MCGRYCLLPDAQAWADLGAVFGQVLAEQLNARAPRYNVAPTQTVPIIVEGDDGTPVILDARWGLIPPWWKKPQPPPLTTNARSETAATKPMWRESWKKQRCLIPASSWYEWFNADEGKSKVANAVMQIVQEGAVEQFRMRTVSTVVGNARNSGPECIEPQLFPEMERQGKAAYRKEQLQWLRVTDEAELTRILVQRLDGMAKGEALSVAERRLWVRELMDRDDADALGELVAEIRATLNTIESKPAAKQKPDSGQSSLF